MVATDLLLASQNPGKLDEMAQLIVGLPFRILSPRDLGIGEAPEETVTSFIENAILKARYYSDHSGRLTVADDSGLSVAAMNGEPGLYSSRFGGEGASDEDRNLLLLDRLRDLPPERRGARFTSAVAVAHKGNLMFQAVESVEGRILETPRGSKGFGYDPLFYYPPLGQTFAEIAPEQKARVSHRGKTFAKLRVFLATLSAA
jgi:XTP/dITP diphosphohydrolase